jgi:hypothetical protein
MWASRFIIEDKQTLINRNMLRRDYKKILSSWKGKLLTLGGRMVRVNSVLSNMVLYMISFFQLPKVVLQRLDYFRSRFFRQGSSEKKICQGNWSMVCHLKDQGGIGIHDLEVKNRALQGKWHFKLLTRNGVWQCLLKWKYIGTSALSQFYWKEKVELCGVSGSVEIRKKKISQTTHTTSFEGYVQIELDLITHRVKKYPQSSTF